MLVQNGSSEVRDLSDEQQVSVQEAESQRRCC